MFILRSSFVAAIIVLVLTSTPAVVEGTCHCAEKCPNYQEYSPYGTPGGCWYTSTLCYVDDVDFWVDCDAYCVCNIWGCNCEPCEKFPGACGFLGQSNALTDEEEEDECADFRYITSLSSEGKREFLAEKYCLDDDKVVVQNIYEILRSEILLKLGGSVLTCALFNKSHGDVSHLNLCEDNQHLVVSLLTSSSTGNTNGGHSFVLVVVGLLGAAMISMKVVQRRHRVFLRRNQYSEVDAMATVDRVHDA